MTPLLVFFMGLGSRLVVRLISPLAATVRTLACENWSPLFGRSMLELHS